MKRLFNDHEQRRVIDLNGSWQFSTDPEYVGEKEGWQNGLPSANTVMVPSVWNNELGLLNYTGHAWYEKKFKTYLRKDKKRSETRCYAAQLAEEFCGCPYYCSRGGAGSEGKQAPCPNVQQASFARRCKQ